MSGSTIVDPHDDPDDGEHLVAHERADADAERPGKRRDDQPADGDPDVVAAGEVGARTRRPAAGCRSRTHDRHEHGDDERGERVRRPSRAANSRSRSGAMRTARGERAMAELARRADGAEEQQHEADELPKLSELRLSAIVSGWPARMLMRTDASTSSSAAAANPSAVRVVRTLMSSPAIRRLTARPPAAASVVSARNASSSEVDRGGQLVQRHAGGERDLADLRRRRRRRRRALRPAPRRRSAPRGTAPCAARPAAGVRTSTPAPAAVRLCTGPCCTSRPRWMTTTSSTVCATSARTWLETSTVRPSAAIAAQEVAQPADALRVEAVGGLVEDEHLAGRRAAWRRARGAGACRASTCPRAGRRRSRARRAPGPPRRATRAAPPSRRARAGGCGRSGRDARPRPRGSRRRCGPGSSSST